MTMSDWRENWTKRPPKVNYLCFFGDFLTSFFPTHGLFPHRYAKRGEMRGKRVGKIECVGKIEDRELSYCYTRILYRVIGSLMIIILYLRLNP